MKTESIQEIWEGFRNSAISKEAVEIQLRDMRMAFFAGFCAMFYISMDPENSSHPHRRAAYFLRLQAELEEFERWLAESVS